VSGARVGGSLFSTYYSERCTLARVRHNPQHKRELRLLPLRIRYR